MATRSKKPETPAIPYNPFFTALNGITLLFSNALSVGIVILLLSALGSSVSFMNRGAGSSSDGDMVGSSFVNFWHSSPLEIAIGLGVVVLIVVFSVVVGAMIHGIQSYTAFRLARGEKATIGEAFNETLANFGNYLLLYIWMNIKIFLWSLLLIVPGVIAYYRYAFSGIVFFDKKLRLNQAINESKRLTKGGIVTFFATHALFSIITFGYIDRVVWLASLTELYKGYAALDATGREKPPIHWLSWLTVGIVAFLLAMLLLAIAFVVYLIVSGIHFS